MKREKKELSMHPQVLGCTLGSLAQLCGIPLEYSKPPGFCPLALLMGVISSISPHSCAPLLPDPLEAKAVRTCHPTMSLPEELTCPQGTEWSIKKSLPSTVLTMKC